MDNCFTNSCKETVFPILRVYGLYVRYFNIISYVPQIHLFCLLDLSKTEQHVKIPTINMFFQFPLIQIVFNIYLMLHIFVFSIYSLPIVYFMKFSSIFHLMLFLLNSYFLILIQANLSPSLLFFFWSGIAQAFIIFFKCLLYSVCLMYVAFTYFKNRSFIKVATRNNR